MVKDDLFKIGLELWFMLPEGRKKKINFIKAFRWKVGVSHKVAEEYYYKCRNYVWRNYK